MTSNDHFEPDSLSQVQAALVRVQESADAFRRVARGNSVETVAKSAADPRLIELLKLVEELPNREDQRTDRDAGRDRAVTLLARRVNKWARCVLAGAGAARLATSSLATASFTWLGNQAGAIKARAARYSEPFTKLELQSICSAALRIVVMRAAADFGQWLCRARLQHPANASAGDFQKLLDEFERELEQLNQRAADRLAHGEKVEAISAAGEQGHQPVAEPDNATA
jgi:hypothetical protein